MHFHIGKITHIDVNGSNFGLHQYYYGIIEYYDFTTIVCLNVQLIRFL